MRRDLFVKSCAFCVSSVLIAFSAPVNAQAATPAPESAPAQKPGESTDMKSDDVPLSKKLNENEGVLKPPHGIDPEMQQQPPANAGDKMPVIVPPGEPGGDQNIQPK
jgi:hypothetical protein